MLYIRLLKALYLFMGSAILWYDIYSKTFKSHESAVNPYDRYISNSTINGKQCTIEWYVDNNKVLRIDEEVNTKVIDEIAKHFGKLRVSIGKRHNFLGIYIDFLAGGKIYLSMKYYIEE